MNKIKYSRLFLILSFFISLILVVILFNGFQQLKSMNNSSDFNSFVYLFSFIALIAILLINLFLSLNYITKTIKETIKENANLKVEKVKRTVETENKEEHIDVQKLVQSVIPKNEKVLVQFAEKFLINLSKELEIVQGTFYSWLPEQKHFDFVAEYAYFGEEKPKPFKIGDTIPGQVAKNQKTLNLEDIPEGYVTIVSGLGKSSPRNILIVPVLYNMETIAIFELASFKKFNKIKIDAIDQVAGQMAENLVSFTKEK